MFSFCFEVKEWEHCHCDCAETNSPRELPRTQSLLGDFNMEIRKETKIVHLSSWPSTRTCLQSCGAIKDHR